MSALFAPIDGGLGVEINCSTGASTAVTLPLSRSDMTALSVTNTGVNYAYFIFGNSSIQATTACYVIVPGDKPKIISMQSGGGIHRPTTVAGISMGGPTTLQVSMGQVYS